jgi:hypothetical protein
MRKLVIIAVVVVMAVSMGMGSAFAANDLQQGKMGVSVGMGDSVFAHKTMPESNGFVNDVVDINGRYFVDRDLAITGGFGLQLDGSDAKGTYFSINGGVRKYLKVDDFAPFVGGQISLISNSVDSNNSITIIDLAAMFGAEYFLNKQFSLEGAVGVGLGTADVKINGNSSTDTYIGTRTLGVRANLYF